MFLKKQRNGSTKKLLIKFKRLHILSLFTTLAKKFLMLYNKISFALLSIAIAFFSCNTSKNKPANKPDVLAANIDSTVNPADDFF